MISCDENTLILFWSSEVLLKNIYIDWIRKTIQCFYTSDYIDEVLNLPCKFYQWSTKTREIKREIKDIKRFYNTIMKK